MQESSTGKQLFSAELEKAQRDGVALLEALQAAPERPDLPVKPHAARLPSGARGVSLAPLGASELLAYGSAVKLS